MWLYESYQMRTSMRPACQPVCNALFLASLIQTDTPIHAPPYSSPMSIDAMRANHLHQATSSIMSDITRYHFYHVYRVSIWSPALDVNVPNLGLMKLFGLFLKFFFLRRWTSLSRRCQPHETSFQIMISCPKLTPMSGKYRVFSRSE